MLYIMELAYYSVQYSACNLLVLAQILGTALRMRANNMVWSDVVCGYLGTRFGGLATYRISTRLDIGINQAKSRTHRTITAQ